MIYQGRDITNSQHHRLFVAAIGVAWFDWNNGLHSQEQMVDYERNVANRDVVIAIYVAATPGAHRD